METNCCKKLDFFLKEEKVAIGYNRVYREYYINLKNCNGNQLIEYCPWCGSELPKSLRNRWFETIENKFGIEDPLDEHQKSKIPEEFFSDLWWKENQ